MKFRLTLAVLAALPMSAQWLKVPNPGAPRTPDGRPELSGIWFIDETPPGEYGERTLALRSEIKPEDIVLTPEGEAQRRRKANTFASAQCLPMGLIALAARQPFIWWASLDMDRGRCCS